jgi:hypothetical protein
VEAYVINVFLSQQLLTPILFIRSPLYSQCVEVEDGVRELEAVSMKESELHFKPRGGGKNSG